MKITNISIPLPKKLFEKIKTFLIRYHFALLCIALVGLSIYSFQYFSESGLTLAYNDARSHLNIGRRVVEGLKPGLAQIGSVWLPLPHLLMVPTIWNDYMWDSGLSGAIQSMISFVATAIMIYLFLKRLGIGYFGRIMGVLIFITNINILYLQSTAMTELLLIGTMTAAAYFLLVWFETESIVDLILTALFLMLSTLIRYDGWFLLFVVTVIVTLYLFKKYGFKTAEGVFIMFCTLGGFGVFLWVLWNLLIFGDPLYFAFGPYSAHAQQAQLSEAGVLATEHNWGLSAKIYLYALVYNSNMFVSILAFFGSLVLFWDKKLSPKLKLASIALYAPLVFNILALYLGHSVLFVQGSSGNTWFNVRYGIMLMPSIAIFVGYLFDKVPQLRTPLLLSLAFVTIFAFRSYDAVTIDDGRVGSSQKNVSEVSGYLDKHAKNEKELILISAASHDAILFSSGLPMKRFVHEGTDKYWESATGSPDHWVRWIVMRTNDDNDQTWKRLKNTPGFKHFNRVDSYPFADIYELDEKYHFQLKKNKSIPGNQ
jgi:hypothetical protein